MVVISGEAAKKGILIKLSRKRKLTAIKIHAKKNLN